MSFLPLEVKFLFFFSRNSSLGQVRHPAVGWAGTAPSCNKQMILIKIFCIWMLFQYSCTRFQSSLQVSVTPLIHAEFNLQNSHFYHHHNSQIWCQIQTKATFAGFGAKIQREEHHHKLCVFLRNLNSSWRLRSGWKVWAVWFEMFDCRNKHLHCKWW